MQRKSETIDGPQAAGGAEEERDEAGKTTSVNGQGYDVSMK